MVYEVYPLVNIQKPMDKHHHFLRVNQLFQWPFSIAFCMFTKGFLVGRRFFPTQTVHPRGNHEIFMWYTCHHPQYQWEFHGYLMDIWWLLMDIHGYLINGNFRILKWRYVSTICLAIFCGDIPWNLGLKNRPQIYGIGTSILGSWHSHWQ